MYEGIQLDRTKEHGILCCIYPAGGRVLTGEMVEGFVKKILKHLEATLDIRLRA